MEAEIGNDGIIAYEKKKKGFLSRISATLSNKKKGTCKDHLDIMDDVWRHFKRIISTSILVW